MPGELQLASAVSNGIVGGIQLFTNLAKEKRDKAELASLEKPFYAIQNEYNQNRNLAAGEAQGGIAAPIQDYFTTESQRGLGAGVSGTLQAGGNPNDIAKLFDIYDRGIDRSYMQSADQHVKNLQYFKDANKDLAGQRTTQWAINKYQPHQNKVAQLTGNIAAAEQNAYNGANQIIGSASAAGTGLENNKLLSDLFKTGGGGNGFSSIPTTDVWG